MKLNFFARRKHEKKHSELLKEKEFYDICVINNPSTNGTGYGGMILKCDECDFQLKVLNVVLNPEYRKSKYGGYALKDLDKWTTDERIYYPPLWRFE